MADDHTQGMHADGQMSYEINNSAFDADYPVDAIIAWVDGSDEDHRLKRESILNAGTKASPVERVARTKRRFSDNDEIRYCVRSIRNYAPWIRKIWILTDRQQPRSIDMALAVQEGIEVVDHTDIFLGHEALLPTFNSLSIETFLWRIPGLANHFLYFNDDMFLTNQVQLSDFFTAGKPILRGKWYPWQDEVPVSFHRQNCKNGAALAGFEGKSYFAPAHVCHSMLKEVLEEAYIEQLPQFARNAAYRFRNRDQFWSVALHDHLALSADKATVYDKPKRDWIHFSVRFCTHGDPADLLTKLNKLAGHQVSMTCLNFLESVVEKVPSAISLIDVATGPRLLCERIP